MGNEDGRVSWFAATSGRVTGVLGLVVAVVLLVVGVTDGSAAVVVGGVLVALLCWLVLLRPRVGTRGDDLLLRGMASTAVIPLASVESVAVRQVLAVRAGGRRHVSAAVGHRLRDMTRKRRPDGAPEAFTPQLAYADHVKEVIEERARDARLAGAEPGPARREWAWLELGGLAVVLVALVVALAVG